MLKPGSHFGCAMFLTVRQREEDAQRTPIAITPLSADAPLHGAQLGYGF
jgi:hypothetical protein